MQAKRLNNTQFETSNDDGGHKHIVTANSCDCADYLFRKQKTGGSCKHMTFIKPLLDNNISTIETPTKNPILEFIKSKGAVHYYDIAQEFNSTGIDIELEQLINKGEITKIKNDRYMVM